MKIESLMEVLVLMIVVTISSAQDCNGVIDDRAGYNYVFNVEPTQRLIREPLGAVVQLTCNATRDDLLGLTWQVIVGGEGIPTSLQAVLQTLDISLSGDLIDSSQLEITGTERNSESICTCVTSIPRQGGGFVQCASEPITVVFYDRPVAPINVTAVWTGVGSLLVSWSLANSEEVVENFTLTATNLNNTGISTITVPGITGQSHTLSIQDTTLCDVYAFRVTAWNDVGSSPHSEIITSIFPLLPDLSMVTLQHSLSKILQERVEITVTFSPTMRCSGYPNTYTLVVEDGSGVLTKSPESTDDAVSIVVNNLMENTRYSYYLMATNSFGSDNSTRTHIKTSDVQDVTICQVHNTQYFIQCIYLDGTDVGGCNYTLVAVEGGAENRTGYAERTDDGEIIQVDSIQLYSELVAHGSSESDEDLAARTSLTIIRRCLISTAATTIVSPTTTTDITHCPTISSDSLVLTSVVTAIVTALLATVIFVLVQIAVCKCHPKFTPAGAKTGTSAGGGEGQEYEEMEGGVVTSDPTYMEVGENKDALYLKENEAYAVRVDLQNKKA